MVLHETNNVHMPCSVSEKMVQKYRKRKEKKSKVTRLYIFHRLLKELDPVEFGEVEEVWRSPRLFYFLSRPIE